MMQRILWGLIAVTALFVALQAYSLAGLALVLGVLWLAAEWKAVSNFGTLFFLAFVGLAVVSALSDASPTLILLGLSTNLAAWDLGRFQARLKDEEASDRKALMERQHLQKLAAALVPGFLIALVTAFVQISVSFVGVCLLVLVAVLVLRQSMLSMRSASKSGS